MDVMDSACAFFRAIQFLTRRLNETNNAFYRDTRLSSPVRTRELHYEAGSEGKECIVYAIGIEAMHPALNRIFAWRFGLRLVAGTWCIDRSVCKKGDEVHDLEEECVLGFPTRTFDTTESMLREWEGLVEELCASTRDLDLR